jgi:hypothetical protein
VSPRSVALTLVAAAAVATACGGGGGNAPDDDALPSGTLGAVTPAAASEAILGLCELSGSTDAEAEAVFLDRSHGTLHVIAAAAETRDRAAVTALLESKQVVEADLARDGLPPSFPRHVERLLDATRAALDAIGLDAPPCPA